MAKLSKVRLCRLLQLAQQLLVLEPHGAEGAALLEPFRGVFGITGICLFDADTAGFYTMGLADADLKKLALDTHTGGREVDDAGSRVVTRRLLLRDRIVGAIAFRGLEDPSLTAEPLTSLAAALLERMRARPKAREAVNVAGVDTFRSGTFDALGDELKNALATILAATGGLREAGPLRAEQLEMARMVEEEASRLGNVVSCLDRIARLDQGEVRPRMDRTDLTALVAQTVEQYSQRSLGRQIVFADKGPILKAFADPEFIRFALGQLLENACKHSVPGSPVRVTMEARGGAVQVSVVSSKSSADSSGECHANTGVGLSVVRRIAAAHGGTLVVDPERRGTESFLLSLPRATGTAGKRSEQYASEQYASEQYE